MLSIKNAPALARNSKADANTAVLRLSLSQLKLQSASLPDYLSFGQLRKVIIYSL